VLWMNMPHLNQTVWYSIYLVSRLLRDGRPSQSVRLVLHGDAQGDHSPDTLKFPDISLTMCGTHAHVKWYS